MYDERDERASSARGTIIRLYQSRGIVPAPKGFACPSLGDCSENGVKPLHTGNWAFVGCDYGSARVEGLPAKVLFVGMDRGGYGTAATEAFPDAQKAFRSAFERPENAHMGGAALIVKQLVDEKDSRKFSSQCALTNAVKCTAQTGSMSTGATVMMIRRCGAHLSREIVELAPDLIVTQGDHPTRTVKKLLAPVGAVVEFVGEKRGKATVSVARSVVVLATPHPARLPGLKWRRGILPAFLVDASRAARAELVQLLRNTST